MAYFKQGGFIAFFFLTGCTTTSDLYHWGQYENLVHAMYANPDKASPGYQIQKIQADIQTAQAKNLRVAPGIYAHLGLMYAALGDQSRSVEAFNNEKRLYPDAAQLIDGMLARAKKANSTNKKEL